jgi:hypothetical protein
MDRRRKVFTDAKVPLLAAIVTAGVNSLRRLRVDDFMIVLTPLGVRVAKG